MYFFSSDAFLVYSHWFIIGLEAKQDSVLKCIMHVMLNTKHKLGS